MIVMEKIILLLGIFLIASQLCYAQYGSTEITARETISYSGGTSSYLGASYIYFGQSLGIGVTFSANVGTFSVNHQKAETMKDGEILDGGEYSWVYNDESVYDRAYLTARLYAKLSGSISSNSSWLYFGVGPGWERYYYGYDRSGSEKTIHVNDENQSKGFTELEAGIAWNSNGFFYSIGYSAIGGTKAPQLTFGIGFDI